MRALKAPHNMKAVLLSHLAVLAGDKPVRVLVPVAALVTLIGW